MKINKNKFEGKFLITPLLSQHNTASNKHIPLSISIRSIIKSSKSISVAVTIILRFCNIMISLLSGIVRQGTW